MKAGIRVGLPSGEFESQIAICRNTSIQLCYHLFEKVSFSLHVMRRSDYNLEYLNLLHMIVLSA